MSADECCTMGRHRGCGSGPYQSELDDGFCENPQCARRVMAMMKHFTLPFFAHEKSSSYRPLATGEHSDSPVTLRASSWVGYNHKKR